MRQKKHILVIRFSTIDDVAMLVPVVKAVAMKYPDVRITVLSQGNARRLFENMPSNVNFMQANLKEDYHGIKGLNKLYRRLVAKQFTHVADMQSIIHSLYLRMRFNLGHFRVEHLNKSHRIHRKQTDTLSLTEKYSNVFAKLGFPVE